MLDPGYYYKKDLKEVPSHAVEVTSDILWVGKYIEKFDFYTHPSWESFMEFLGIPYFLVRHGAYNALRLSTQVPARQHYLVKAEVPEILYKTKFFAIPAVPEDISIFDNFTPLEYMFVDSLARNNWIIFDGYFKTESDLFKGIFSRMVQCKVDKKKILMQAVKENPDLILKLNKKQRSYVEC